MGLIQIEDMEFYAYHGCYQEEAIVGNQFLVNLELETSMDNPAETDNIEDALNYQIAYQLVKREMAKRSHLLEHIGKRILDALYAEFSGIERASIKISKMNPPMGGKMKCVSVTLTR